MADESENSITLHATFDSPDEAIPAADAIVEAGFTDVRLFVVMEARVSGTPEELQRVHDRVQEIPADVLPRTAGLTKSASSPEANRLTSGQGSPSYTQVDMTERFGDHEDLGPEDWIETIPLNRFLAASVPDPQEWGLPAIGASDEEVYEVASRLSDLRERIPGLQDEGVYCPICHIANTQIERLHSPCPRCSRPLLQFGWN